MPTLISNCEKKREIYDMNEYRPDLIKPVWEEIEMVHLRYLHEDENPMKLVEKRRLDALIKKYLQLVPPQKKFIFALTKKVFHESLRASGEEFCCYKNVTAWNGIAVYANNLLTQPWRREFRTIKLYNGFYKHTIDKYILNSKVLLELIGYTRKNDKLYVLEEPFDPDRVTSISKDSIIASVECQIIRSIYSEVFKTNREVKWTDIFTYRESYGGSIEDSAAAFARGSTALTFKYHNPMPFYQPSMFPVAQAVPYVISPHQVIQQVPVDQVYLSDGYYTQPVPDYHTSPRIMPTTSQFVSCPTGQLIEFESGHQPQPMVVPTTRALAQSDQIQHYPQQSGLLHHRRSSSDHVVSNSAGEINYLYGRRPSYGYNRTTANQWEFGDTWRPCAQDLLDSEDHSAAPEPGYFPRNISNGESWMNREVPSEEQTTNSNNEWDCDINVDLLQHKFNELLKDDMNIDDTKRNTRKKKKNKNITATIFNRDNKSKKSNRDYTAGLRVNLDSVDQIEENKWNCLFCTFLNLPTKEVCEMCGKSKNKEAEVPLASGGRQCPKCTLVNKRGAIKCDVCDTSLKDSPTYI